MNLILRVISTTFKDKMSQIISTSAGDHPLPDDLICIEDLSYTSSDGTPQAADVYRPKDKSQDPLPIAVFVHGGGFLVGTRKAYRTYAELLAQRGYVVFMPEYRLIGEENGAGIGAIADVCAGLSYLKDHAADFGGNLAQILVIGESAGGFLSLYATALLHSPLLQETLGIKAPELSVRGLACFGGMLYTANFDIIGLVYRRSLFGELLYDQGFKELIDPESPRVVSYLPPVLQVTSRADFLRRYTLSFNETLAMAGHDHRLIYYKKGSNLKHAFPSLHPELPQSREVLHALDFWFRELLAQGEHGIERRN